MNKGLELLRVCLICPELAAALVPPALAIHFPLFAPWLASEFIPSDVASRTTFLATPLVLLTLSYGLCHRILNPEVKLSLLKEWPSYWRLKLRVWVGLVYSGIAAAAFIVGWSIYSTHDALLGATIMLVALSVSVTTLVSLALARIQLTDALHGV